MGFGLGTQSSLCTPSKYDSMILNSLFVGSRHGWMRALALTEMNPSVLAGGTHPADDPSNFVA